MKWAGTGGSSGNANAADGASAHRSTSSAVEAASAIVGSGRQSDHTEGAPSRGSSAANSDVAGPNGAILKGFHPKT
jgi:hypothetical protein